MSVQKIKTDFFDTEEGIEIEKILESMTKDASYDTAPRYSANVKLYPDNLMSFVDKHIT